MGVKAATRLSPRPSVFKSLGKENMNMNQVKKNMVVCKYWLEGRCNRNPCRFLHSNNKSKYSWKNPTIKEQKMNNNSNAIITQTQDNIGKKTQKSTCKQTHHQNYSICGKGTEDQLHSWFHGKELSLVAKLEGHSKAITGIALPSGSDNLYCSSKDKSLRIWDYSTGKCGTVVDLGMECETLVNEDSWIFAGLTDGNIKGWNLKTQSQVILERTGGKVNAITTYNDLLFAAIQDGTILAWKSTSETSFSQVAVALKGHTGAVLSLVVGAHKLFSGSADHTIRVWDPKSLECMHVLKGHTGDVTTVLCWDNYLLSGSLDKNIKVSSLNLLLHAWAATENGNIEEIYQHNVDEEMLQFHGILDAEDKPILVCACKDSSVRLYDLPSFSERGRIYSRQQVETIRTSPGGQLFVGDARGLLSLWKLT
ncbi:G-protein beta WD-40 repeat-containing protein [Cynara cardunculus var. scolymus]|uniref:G-protein beta WD-40 repeat-containing protein n=1 Tax=Cynara cardunculus var. scolymus TaxID=59895 RepID=A0A118K6R1_CYNCS|nr:G-protein beta WD-40 repeat-containing protein [Cynara cardunculus var. scolymus]